MIFIGTKLYLRFRARKLKIKWNSNYLSNLHQYNNMIKAYGCRLDFHWRRCSSFKELNCNAGFGKHTTVVASLGWAEKLVFSNSEEVRNAFLMSLGHELTHKENDANILSGLFVKNGIKFIAYANEVHADFGAVMKFGEGNKEKQLKAMKYKQSCKRNPNASDFFHPSWNERYAYINTGMFDENLIRRIAKNVDCTNEHLIEKVINHFEEIHLI